MMRIVRRQIPIVIVVVTTVLVMTDYFLKIPGTSPLVTMVNNWAIILTAFTLGFGAINLFYLHTRHIRRRTPGQWFFSFWLLLMVVVFAGTGIFTGATSTTYTWLYNSSYFALSATVYSSLGFYMTSAIYRSLRARNIEAMLLLITGSIAVMRNAPALAAALPILVDMDKWLSDFVVTSAQRGIMIGASLGAIALGVRTLTGRETGFLGRLTEAEREG